jgi:tetratricopeptide (TPR) repeat protein
VAGRTTFLSSRCNEIEPEKQIVIDGVFRAVCPVTKGRLDPVRGHSQYVAVPDTSREPESIGARIRRLRLERGLSQRELSEPGVSYAYVSRIEAGARHPSLKAIRILAGKLGVSPEYVETGAGMPRAYDQEIRLGDAELALRLGEDAEQAEPAFRALVAEANETVDDAVEVRARIGLGLALAARGQHAEAIVHLERAEGSGAVTPSSRPDVYAALGRSYTAVGELRRAVALLERALESLAEHASADRAVEFRLRSQLSSALVEAGELQRARSVLLEAPDPAQPRLDLRPRIILYRTLARIAAADGEPVAAMTHLRRALGVLESSEDTVELARAHLHCAETLLLEGHTDQAGSHLERADRLLEHAGEEADLAALRTQQAHLAVRTGAADDAIALATEALGYLAEDAVEAGGAWHALGAAHALKDDVEAAAESLRRAVELLRERGEWREAMTAYRIWAQVLREAGRDQEAFDVIEQATLLTLRNAGTTTRRQYTRR